MKRVAALWLWMLPVSAAWVETKSGPFIVYCDAGNDTARDALYRLEQFRFIFGEALGRSSAGKELKSVWPITAVVSKTNQGEAVLGFSRDGWIAAWNPNTPPAPAFWKKMGAIFIEENLTGRMPGDLEEAITSLYSTMTVEGRRVVLGTPPPAAERTRSWGMLHFLLTNAETAGRTKALISNLAYGADPDTAFRNAFEKPKSALDAAIDQAIKSGNAATITLPGRPFDVERQFTIVQAMPSRIRVMPGDVLLAKSAPAAQVRGAYTQALNERASAAGHEGLGLALLQEKQADPARKEFEAVVTDEAPGARALLELAKLESDVDRKRKLLERASQKAPLWAEPFLILASLEPGPVRKAYWLVKATELQPRRAETWWDLAQAQFDSKKFPEADKSWRTAERVASTEEQRAELTKGREAFEQARYDAQAAERARIKKEEIDDVERVRQENLASIRKAEQQTSSGGQAPTGKMEKWWDGPKAETYLGTLDAVACQGKSARLNVRGADGKAGSFAIVDPTKVVIFGANQTVVQLQCGPQKPPKRVKIEYVPRPGATGEVVTVEFQ